MYELNKIIPCPEKPVSLQSLVAYSSRCLEENGIDEAQLQSELLLCEVLKCSRASLRSAYDKILGDNVIKQYEMLIDRRMKREPLQYILGNAEFMGLKFIVNRSVFIPRPETELLVETARELGYKHKDEILHLLDVGTGSGNIAVSIAYTCRNITIDAIDSDDEALLVAEANIKLHELTGRIRTFNYDIFDESSDKPLEYYDIVVSNPPYIPLSEYLTLEPEVRDFEPCHACTDGADGLTFYRGISRLCQTKLRDGGHLVVEIGYDQSWAVSKILSETGFQNIKVLKDYAGIDRIIAGEKP